MRRRSWYGGAKAAFTLAPRQGNVKDTAVGGVIGGILGGPIGAGVGGYLGYSYSQHALGDLQTGMMRQQHDTTLPTEPLTALFGH